MFQDLIDLIQKEIDFATNEDYINGLGSALSIIRKEDYKLKKYITQRIKELEEEFNKYQQKYMKDKSHMSLHFYGKILSAINCKEELEKILKLERS